MSFKYIPVTNLKTIGINDSADSLFRDGDFISDKYSSALREYFQNSIDAVRKSKNKRLQFNVKLENLDLDFFDFKDLEKMISKCIKTIEANQSGADNIEIKRFRKIIKDCKEVNSEFVECVVFEDNGLGLDGGSIASKGNKNTGWSRIIGDDISDKNHGELGSFGIGKSTAFSIANLNTIFYLSSHKQKKYFSWIH